jgi:hypothetical membrane protein
VRKALLACGIVAPLIYIGTDLAAAALYPGYSFADQAVSELFAIGAPTARLVVLLFSLSSSLLFAFAAGVRMSSRERRIVRFMAVAITANAIDSLVLWTVFPMHMRGVEPTSTDLMHGVFAINPFVLLTVALGAFAFRGWFRIYSIITIVLIVLPAASAFFYVAAFLAHQPTPGMGLTERLGQYDHQLWHAVLAVVLLRRDKTTDTP